MALSGNNIFVGAAGQDGYKIKQSLKFNNTGDVASLSRTPSVDGNKQVATLSFWVKNCGVSTAAEGATAGTNILYAGNSSADQSTWSFSHENPTFFINNYRAGPGNGYWTTDAIYRDPSNWYHFVISYNQGTVTYYVNGEVNSHATTIGGWAGAVDTAFNSNGVLMRVGPNVATASVKSIYLAELHWIDGQALDASEFGETNPLTNQWVPKKYVGTHGTNGFYLDFANSANFGQDKSGNGNNLTATGLAATDQVPDSPTNNFATINALTQPGGTGSLSEGNLKFNGTADYAKEGSFEFPTSGKWYYEAYLITSDRPYIGIRKSPWSSGSPSVYYWVNEGLPSGWAKISKDGSNISSISDLASPYVLGVAFDSSTGYIEFFRNGSSIGSTTVSDTSVRYIPSFSHGSSSGQSTFTLNFGQDSSFAGAKTAQGNKDANGRGDFYYPVPAGHLALCSDNLPTPEIALPGEHFNTLLYTGLYGTSDSYTGVGFQPGFTWLKHRDNGTAYGNQLYDSVRGATNYLISNTTGAENDGGAPLTTGLQSFDSDGFTIGQTLTVNASGVNHVAWNWKADGTAGSVNTDGAIVSTVSANPAAGFSIVSYTGSGDYNSATVGHGLSQAPDCVIIKKRASNGADGDRGWVVWHKDLAQGDFLHLNTTGAQSAARHFGEVGNGTYPYVAPNSSVIHLSGTQTGSYHETNFSGDDYIMYCFHGVENYSKIGTYVGNGNTDGPFVYTGFQPAFVLIKRTDGIDSWFIFDIERDTVNPLDSWLAANLTNTETVNLFADAVSNGFKVRGDILAFNANGGTYIYMAFAKNPFKYSNAR